MAGCKGCAACLQSEDAQKFITRRLLLPKQSQTGVAPATAQSQTPRRRQIKVPAIPLGFRQYASRMKQAYAKGEEPGLVMAFMEGLLYLRESSEEWAPFIEEMMVSAAEGKKYTQI